MYNKQTAWKLIAMSSAADMKVRIHYPPFMLIIGVDWLVGEVLWLVRVEWVTRFAVPSLDFT